MLRLAQLLVNKIQGVVGDFASDFRPDGALLLEESVRAVVRNLTSDDRLLMVHRFDLPETEAELVSGTKKVFFLISSSSASIKRRYTSVKSPVDAVIQVLTALCFPSTRDVTKFSRWQMRFVQAWTKRSLCGIHVFDTYSQA
ncbi:hypothetical protein PsorP6_005637 [Peronosclerospora sorghi]|uniref:Uncharacterized protein n=1 Tax=Peronosclerospora sorghi TaxID=230839 RepID=A0ACC0W7X6_9STRA|nr:hypothetical protein PsorP6_005637 [Peronosclerospora sorghi]